MEDEEYFDVDFIERDPNNMNEFLLLGYSKVIAEPYGNHSKNCVWQCSHSFYYGGKELIYSLLTFFFGLQIAFFWGCMMASISFVSIWQWGPTLRFIIIQANPVKKLTNIYLRSFVGPFIEAMAFKYSRIHVNNSQGSLRRRIDDFNLNDKNLQLHLRE